MKKEQPSWLPAPWSGPSETTGITCAAGEVRLCLIWQNLYRKYTSMKTNRNAFILTVQLKNGDKYNKKVRINNIQTYVPLPVWQQHSKYHVLKADKQQRKKKPSRGSKSDCCCSLYLTVSWEKLWSSRTQQNIAETTDRSSNRRLRWSLKQISAAFGATLPDVRALKACITAVGGVST